MTPNQIGDRLFQALEENSQLFTSASEEIKFQIKTVLESQVEKLGLVTRDEFETLRITLDRAVARVAVLESEHSEPGSKPDSE